MARPSLKAQRRETILDATERCVARYGLEGSTLDKIAEEAGLARALVRHNVGNRDALILQLMDRFIANTGKQQQALDYSHAANAGVEDYVKTLFAYHPESARIALLAQALMVAAATNPDIASRMRQWNEGFLQRLEARLRTAYPKSGIADCREVAAGIAGIYFNVESMDHLDNSSRSLRKRSLNAALRLPGTLNQLPYSSPR